MKFSAQLKEAIVPEWKAHYLDYELLKEALLKAEEDGAFTDRNETEFVELLDSNLEKVNAFHKSTLKEIHAEMDSCATHDKMNQLVDKINQLQHFSRINYTGFLKIVKKHDRYTDYILRPMFMVRLNQCPFWKEDHSDLLYKLSELSNKVRGGSLQHVPLKSQQQREDSRRMIVKKYFVHTNNLLELKTSVLRHLPVLVYRDHENANGKDDMDPPISSLYLDNVNLDAYRARVEANPSSQIIRLRWYGSAEKNRNIYIERRTHEDENKGQLNEKFIIKEKYIYGFLHGETTFLEKSVEKMKNNGTHTIEEIANYSNLVQDVQQHLIKEHMEPLLRVYYKRTAFQIPGDNNVRMALDTDLCFLREDNHLFPDEKKIRRPEKCWKRPDADINYPFRDLREEEVTRYPYATFEIKLNLDQKEKVPKWVVDLQKSGLLQEAYQFSKFVHGVAIMFDTRVPLLPYWLAQIDDDRKLLPILPSQSPSVSRPRTRPSTPVATERTSLLRNASSYGSTTVEQNQSTPSNNGVGLLSRRFFSSTDQPVVLPPGVKIPKKIITPIKVEPKVFFANERTYFSWMKVSTVLATFAIALFNKGDTVGKLCGIMYTLIAISTLMYGCGLYYRRRELIRSRLPGPYQELIGPTILCLALMFAIGMNFYLKYNMSFWKENI